ncbi:MAG: hypothetical protein C5S46_02715 [Candidatus Methanomarinus sp.]|uniref:Uncharacterized protein n=1 Tax=Candidatus Methanomarinus sp. TaxID=3386244 RepID=A0AC61SCE7_9EURY|nr:MAG: hypothetical protein C5S46_02715 [ANME-2 cluster archaeon]
MHILTSSIQSSSMVSWDSEPIDKAVSDADADPAEERNEEEPGFEVVLAAGGLLRMALLIKRKKIGRYPKKV